MNEQYACGTMWQVAGSDLSPTNTRAGNWLQALGNVLTSSWESPIGRMACERLPNGDMIAHDLTNGRRFVIQQLTALLHLSAADLEPLNEEDEETEEVFTMEEDLEDGFMLLEEDLETEEVSRLQEGSAA